MRKLLSVLLLLVPPLASAHDLAIVNGHAITDQEVYALNPATKENPQARNQLLQELINRTLILQAAKKEGLDRTPAFQKDLAQQREQLLVNAAAARWLKEHPSRLRRSRPVMSNCSVRPPRSNGACVRSSSRTVAKPAKSSTSSARAQASPIWRHKAPSAPTPPWVANWAG